MISMKCSGCQGEISIERQYVGEMIQCPHCGALQIVPNQLLDVGSEYNGYVVQRVISASVLWTAYEVVAQADKLALHIPTSFFLKRVSDIPSFADAVIYGSSFNRPELPSLVSHSLSQDVFFVFDYQADAVKLTSLIKQRPMDLYSALQVTRNIAVCLKSLWDEYGVLHQCLIPDNIWITPGLGIRIANTGLSSHLLADRQLLESGFNIWDYHYISPEFMNEGLADTPSCDIYSLGAVLFYLCTGRHPNEGVAPEHVASTPAPLLSEFLPEAPTGMSVLLQLLMSPDISSRPASWGEVIKHIDLLLASHVQPSSVPFNLSSFSLMTDHHRPVGMSPGDLTQSINRAAAVDSAGGKGKASTLKTIKPISKSSLSTMNKKWDKNPKIKPVGMHRGSPEDEKPCPTKKKNNNTPVVMALSIAALVAASVVAVLVINASKAKTKVSKTAARPAAETGMSDSELAYTRQLELLRKQGIDPASLGEKQTKAPESPVSSKASEARPRTRPAFSPDSPEDVVSMLKKKIKPMLMAEKYDRAIKVLVEYDGELAEESRPRRMAIAEEIRARIKELRTTDAAAERPAEPVSEDDLRRLASRVAPLLFSGQVLGAQQMIEAAAVTAEGNIKENLDDWLAQIASFERLKPLLDGEVRADPVISNEDNKQLTELHSRAKCNFM
ncbi:MAG: protein kinase [Victivallales bacterium]|nr:protein kinase [Victivallales bacterium]